MSKKRRKNRPNISDAALERARQEIAGDEVESDEDSDSDKSAVEVKAPSPRRTSRKRKAMINAGKVRRHSGEMSGELIAELLASPTKEVTEEELREDYSYVLHDLRSMGILAGVLLVILIGLGIAQSFLV